ncbi:RimJ/RimL family protein N-acetyltransferase [Cohnella lubricantis]|nr:RimJ/RimL family protein N-acetyltransferase [Cohnella lubricantis]
MCVLQAYWGCAIGRHLLQASVRWADANGIARITLNVLETNTKAIQLYEQFGFEMEGVLRKDKRLSDGRYYNTVVMGRC